MLTSASDQGSGRAPGAGVPYQDPALDPDHEAVDLALESDLAQLAWALGRVGWLLVLVGLVVAGLNLLPLQPWEGSWWRALAGVLLQAAPLPLLGSSLVHLGAFLDPADRLLLRRLRRVRRGAALLAVLFLLLVPLQLWTGWSVDRLSSGARDRAEQKLSRRFLALQSAVGGMALSLIGMGFAATGHLSPVSGAIAQEIIDVLAVLNALRAAFPPKTIHDL